MKFFAHELTRVGAVLLTLGLLSGHTLAGNESGHCDCSCSGYKSLIDQIDLNPTLAANHIDQCGASCAIAWARCEGSAAMALNRQAAAGHPADQQAALSALLEQFLRGASSGDASMHDRFWSDDLVYTSSSGQRYGKTELMAGLTSSQAQTTPAPIYSADQVRIRIYDQLALIDFILVATANGTGQQRFLNSGALKQEGDQWRAVNWQATRKAEP